MPSPHRRRRYCLKRKDLSRCCVEWRMLPALTREECMRPFEGIRVIDMTHVLAGPFATYQLALLGADVIKVESPDDPDQMRDHGNNSLLRSNQMATGFLTQSANKKCITLNLKKPEAREVLKKLVRDADV